MTTRALISACKDDAEGGKAEGGLGSNFRRILGRLREYTSPQEREINHISKTHVALVFVTVVIGTPRCSAKHPTT